MAKEILIRIPKPCHENWDAMTPTAQGAFCKSCSKNVIDFSRKTENEIYNMVTASDGHLCGRFAAEQLDRPIRKTEMKNGWLNWRALAASLAAFFSFGKLTNAGDVAPKPKTEVCSKDTLKGNPLSQPVDTMQKVEYYIDGLTVKGKPVYPVDTLLSGYVSDAETKEGLGFASVHIKNTEYGVLANSRGDFKLDLDLVDTTSSSLLLEVSLLGYESVTIPLTEFIKAERKRIELCPVNPLVIEAPRVMMQDVSHTMGAYVVIHHVIDPDDLQHRYDPKLDIRKKVREQARKEGKKK